MVLEGSKAIPLWNLLTLFFTAFLCIVQNDFIIKQFLTMS